MSRRGPNVTHKVDGKEYTFRVFPVGTRFDDRSAIYAFAKISIKKLDAPECLFLYVGQSQHINQRITDNHEKFDCAKAFGMTHILIRDTDPQDLDGDERTLIEDLNPPCNVQHCE